MVLEQTTNSKLAGETPVSEALEASITAGLAAAFADEPSGEGAVEPVVDSSGESTDEPVEEGAVEEEAVEEEAVEEGAVEEEAEQPPEAPAATGPILPDSYIRSLKAYGWSDAEISSAHKADPAAFTLTAQKLHWNRAKEIAQFAELGRRQAERPKVEAKAPVASKPGLIDIDDLIEKHGNEELIRDLYTPVNAFMEQITAMLPDLNSGVKAIRDSQQHTLGTQIDEFFKGPELAQFSTVYGKDYVSATPEQSQSRMKVLEFADAVIAGAQLQGRDLSLSEALGMAHEAVSANFKTTAIRNEIKKGV